MSAAPHSQLQRLRPHVAHGRGFTDVAFSADGSKILTIGDDANLRIVPTTSVRDGDDGDDDDAAIEITEHSGALTCLDVLGNLGATGSEDQSVHLYDLQNDTARHLKLLFRTTLTVRDVALRPGQHGPRKSRQIAIASDELDIRVVDIDEITHVVTIKGHKRGLKSLAWDPKGEFLVSAGSDGELMVWDMRGEKPRLERTLRNLIAESDPETNELCRIAWQSSGNRFAVPGKGGEIAVVEAGTWRHLYSFKEENRSDCVAGVAWSGSGSYLVSVNVKGRVCIWRSDGDRKVPLVSDQGKARVTGVSWNPKAHDLCLTDELGRLFYWPSAVPASEQDKRQLESLFAEEAHPMDVDRPAKTPGPNAPLPDLADYNAELLADLEDDDEAGDAENADDFVEDDDGAGYADPLDKPGQLRRYHEKGRQKVIQDLHREYGSRNFDITTTDEQEPFQPGATPTQKDRRYLAFNMVGVIYTIDASTHHNVNVEFHDRAVRPFHFTDYHSYSMAALAASGACFASEATATNRSTVFFRPLDTWATKADWTVHLGETESVEAVAITGKGPVVATSTKYLRFFSYSGLQTNVVSIPGRIVTLAAQGERLMIVYHAGAAYHSDQNLAYMLYDVSSRTTIQRAPLPLSSGTTLIWASISELGIPVTYDSSGVLRALFQHSDYAWVPVLDSRILRGEKQEWYWPVEVLEDKLMCVTLKAGDKFPGFPRPLMSDVPLQAPFLEMEAPNTGVQEEKIFRESLMAAHHRGEALAAGEAESREREMLKRDVEIDKVLVQLILASCKSEKVQRALDLCSTLQTIKAIDGAIKIAVMNHLPGLAERMNLIKEGRLREKQEKEELRSYGGGGGGGGAVVEQPRPTGRTRTTSGGGDRSSRPTRADSSDVDPIGPTRHDGPGPDPHPLRDHQQEQQQRRAKPKAAPRVRNPFAVADTAAEAAAGSPARVAGRASPIRAGHHNARNLFEALREVTTTAAAAAAGAEGVNGKAEVAGGVKRKHNQMTLLGSLKRGGGGEGGATKEAGSGSETVEGGGDGETEQAVKKTRTDPEDEDLEPTLVVMDEPVAVTMEVEDEGVGDKENGEGGEPVEAPPGKVGLEKFKFVASVAK
ncbi:uncharacterized protein EV422DRAFT_542541 [Fimicolochytrium jonesii]|uniref:uncharacterized protein n=1 Tax=Fimicolochytrium jonesii TaxID=1396493 RepID=UPI0022FE8D69|nr:uncharacterized protein EV422DRAFT_542541 [Fimicolochytrium jonesii]KAI8817137.1 hypothetical protein EV422DRAFT_542541 [Fimicolochytrium jonesii]